MDCGSYSAELGTAADEFTWAPGIRLPAPPIKQRNKFRLLLGHADMDDEEFSDSGEEAGGTCSHLEETSVQEERWTGAARAPAPTRGGKPDPWNCGPMGDPAGPNGHGAFAQKDIYYDATALNCNAEPFYPSSGGRTPHLTVHDPTHLGSEVMRLSTSTGSLAAADLQRLEAKIDGIAAALGVVIRPTQAITTDAAERQLSFLNG